MQVVALLNGSLVFPVAGGRLKDNGLLDCGGQVFGDYYIMNPEALTVSEAAFQLVTDIGFCQIHIEIRKIPQNFRQKQAVTAVQASGGVHLGSIYFFQRANQIGGSKELPGKTADFAANFYGNYCGHKAYRKKCT